MPRRVVIQQERQSTRVRAAVDYNEFSSAFGILPHVAAQLEANQSVTADDDNDEDYFGIIDSEKEADGGYHPRPRLSPATVQKWKLSELMECIDNGLVELNPEYQRGIVWNAKMMTGLVNSLIEEYYVPPVIFNLEIIPGPTGDQIAKRICVDGKQRLSSVHAFMTGAIPCHDRSGKTWFYCNNGMNGPKIKKRYWPEHLKQEFRNRAFVCYEYKQLNRCEEEDLFGRVQKGMPLNAAEKLKAMSGAWQDLARLFEFDFADIVALSAAGRGTGFRNLLTAFAQILEVRNPTRPDGLPACKMQMPATTSLCSRPKLCDEATKSHLASVFSKFQELVEQSPQTFQDNHYKRMKKFAPIELVAVAVLISKYMGTRNNVMLIGDIYAMRDETRKALADLRMDNTTWKTIWQYIDELPSFRGASDGSVIAKGPAKSLTIAETSRASNFHTPRAQEAYKRRPRSKYVDSITGEPHVEPGAPAKRPAIGTGKTPVAPVARMSVEAPLSRAVRPCQTMPAISRASARPQALNPSGATVLSGVTTETKPSAIDTHRRAPQWNRDCKRRKKGERAESND